MIDAPVSRLLRPGAEVQYVERRRSVRSRVFWSRPSAAYGVEALALPAWVRPFGARRWEPFDHGSADELRRLFSFGPVLDRHLRLIERPEAPPFFVHLLTQSGGTRAKLRAAISSICWAWGPPHRTASWMLRVPYAAGAVALPEPYATWWRGTLEEVGTSILSRPA